MGLKIKLNKKNASDNFGILQVQYFNNSVKPFKKSLKIKIDKKDYDEHFDQKQNHFKESYTDHLKTNALIQKGLLALNLIDKTQKTHIQKKFREDSITEFINEVPEEKSFITFFETCLSVKETQGTADSARCALIKLKSYVAYRYANRNPSNIPQPISGQDLKFKEISSEFMRDFQKFCFEVPNQYDTKMGVNGWLNYLKVIKKVINDAESTKTYIFPTTLYTQLIKKTRTRTISNALTLEKFKRLDEIELEDSKLSLAREIFKMGVICNGMRFQDIVLIRWEMFKDCQFTYTMGKTKGKPSIKMSYNMSKIIYNIIKPDPTSYDLFLYKEKLHQLSDGKIYSLEDMDLHLESQKSNILADSVSLMLKKAIGYKGKSYNYTPLTYEIISFRNELKDNKNHDLFIIFVQELINKMKKRDFMFLDKFNSKQALFFTKYNSIDKMSKLQYTKYKGIRNDYNNRLKKITKIYNESLPPSANKFANVIKLSAHCSRHTFTNIMIDANVDVFKISNALVHSNIATTNAYIRGSFNKQASDLAHDKWDDLL